MFWSEDTWSRRFLLLLLLFYLLLLLLSPNFIISRCFRGLMYLFKLKAYLSSIKGYYITRYKAQPFPEWPLSVGRGGGAASVLRPPESLERRVCLRRADRGCYPLFYIGIRAQTVWAAAGMLRTLLQALSKLFFQRFLFCHVFG